MPHPITARQDPATALLRDRIRQFFKVLPAALTFDEEGIHDMRVTTRRLGVILPVLGRKPNRKRIKHATRVMRSLRRAAGVSRDLDVSLALLDEHLSVSPDQGRDTAILRKRLCDARRRSHRRMEKSLADFDPQDLRRDLEAILARKADDLFTVLRRLRDRERSRSAKLLSAMDEIGDAYDPDALHRLRGRVRRMRYLAEIHARVLDRPQEAARLFREMQDVLGRLHDLHVLSLWLERQIVTSGKRGDAGVVWAARGLKRSFEEKQRETHRAYLALNPPAFIRRALKAMRPGESAA